MNTVKADKAYAHFRIECERLAGKIQPYVDWGTVSVDYYGSDGVCASVETDTNSGVSVVPLCIIPEGEALSLEWWIEHSV